MFIILIDYICMRHSLSHCTCIVVTERLMYPFQNSVVVVMVQQLNYQRDYSRQLKVVLEAMRRPLLVLVLMDHPRLLIRKYPNASFNYILW